MDKFVNVKNNPHFFHVCGRQDLAKTLWEFVNSKKLVCVFGKPGVGKTHIVTLVLGENRINLEQDVLKSKILTQNFMSLVKDCNTNILIDDFDSDLPGSKEIIESSRNLSRGSTVIVTENIQNIENCEFLEIKPFNEDEIDVLWPGHSEAAQRCKGNLHNFNFYKQFSHDKDTFKNPKEVINELLSTKKHSYITNSLEEHGHSLSVVHENYTDAKIDIHEMANIAEGLSMADVYDTEIYKSNWEFIRYFQIVGIATPCHYINGTINPKNIRPGSCWSKHNNMKMRQGKIRKFRMDVSSLIYLLGFIKFNPQLAVYYDIQPADVDVLNHLRLKQKFKASEVQCLKKRISALYQ